MKKLLTLFTLLLTVCSGAWGEKVSFVGGTASGQINVTSGSGSQELSSTPVTINIVSPGSKSQNRQIWKDGSTAKNEYAFQLSSGAGSEYNTKYVEISVASGYKITGVTLRAAANGTTAGTVYGYCFEGAFSTETGAVKAVGSFAVPGNGGTSDGANVAMTGIANNTRTVRIYKQVKYDSETNTINGTDGSSNPSTAITVCIASITVTYEATAPSIPTLTGAWKIGDDEVTSVNVVQGGSVTIPTFTVGATSGTPDADDYTVTYSLKDGSATNIFTFTESGGPTEISTANVGTATLVATLASIHTEEFEDADPNTFEYTVTVNAPAAPTFSPVAGAVASGTEITMTSPDGGEIWYTTNGEDPTESNKTVYDEEAKPTITGTTTIKAIARVNGYSSAVAEATYTKIVLDEQTDITGSTEWDWTTVTAGPGELTGTLRDADIIVSNLSKLGVTAITAPSEFDQTGLLINGQYAYRSANGTKLCQVNYLKFNTTVPGILRIEYANTGGNDTRTVCVEVNEGTPEYGTHSSNGNAYSATPEDNKYVIDEFNVSAGTIKIKGVLNNDHSTDKMLRIRKVTFIETVPVEVSALGYATFASDKALDFTDKSIKAYKATVTGTTVNFTQVNVVPAGEGVLLYAAGGASIDVPVTTADADDFEGNRLKPGTGAALTYGNGAEYYILSNESAGIGFYKANGNVVYENKAYLDLTGTNAKSFALPGGETDGIRSIDNSELRVENSNYYNLAGQRVGKDYKGIVIVNGKKMLNK